MTYLHNASLSAVISHGEAKRNLMATGQTNNGDVEKQEYGAWSDTPGLMQQALGPCVVVQQKPLYR